MLNGLALRNEHIITSVSNDVTKETSGSEISRISIDKLGEFDGSMHLILSV